MTKLPVLSYRELAKKLRRAGFEYVRTGRHEVYYDKSKNLTIPIPHHSGDVPKGLLRAIINQAGLTVEEFVKL